MDLHKGNMLYAGLLFTLSFFVLIAHHTELPARTIHVDGVDTSLQEAVDKAINETGASRDEILVDTGIPSDSIPFKITDERTDKIGSSMFDTGSIIIRPKGEPLSVREVDTFTHIDIQDTPLEASGTLKIVIQGFDFLTNDTPIQANIAQKAGNQSVELTLFNNSMRPFSGWSNAVDATVGGNTSSTNGDTLSIHSNTFQPVLFGGFTESVIQAHGVSSTDSGSIFVHHNEFIQPGTTSLVVNTMAEGSLKNNKLIRSDTLFEKTETPFFDSTNNFHLNTNNDVTSSIEHISDTGSTPKSGEGSIDNNLDGILDPPAVSLFSSAGAADTLSVQTNSDDTKKLRIWINGKPIRSGDSIGIQGDTNFTVQWSNQFVQDGLRINEVNGKGTKVSVDTGIINGQDPGTVNTLGVRSFNHFDVKAKTGSFQKGDTVFISLSHEDVTLSTNKFFEDRIGTAVVRVDTAGILNVKERIKTAQIGGRAKKNLGADSTVQFRIRDRSTNPGDLPTMVNDRLLENRKGLRQAVGKGSTPSNDDTSTVMVEAGLPNGGTVVVVVNTKYDTAAVNLNVTTAIPNELPNTLNNGSDTLNFFGESMFEITFSDPNNPDMALSNPGDSYSWGFAFVGGENFNNRAKRAGIDTETLVHFRADDIEDEWETTGDLDLDFGGEVFLVSGLRSTSQHGLAPGSGGSGTTENDDRIELIERIGTPEKVLDSMRRVRDGIMNSAPGRVVTTWYYEIFGPDSWATEYVTN